MDKKGVDTILEYYRDLECFVKRSIKEGKIRTYENIKDVVQACTQEETDLYYAFAVSEGKPIIVEKTRGLFYKVHNKTYSKKELGLQEHAIFLHAEVIEDKAVRILYAPVSMEIQSKAFEGDNDDTK